MFYPTVPAPPIAALPPIIVYGNPGRGRPGLVQSAVAVPTNFPIEDTAAQLGLRTIIQTMVDVLAAAGSVGGALAAPQVGLDIRRRVQPPHAPLSLMLRIFIIATTDNNNNKCYQEFINPVLSFQDDYTPTTPYEAQWGLGHAANDGCLSLPGVGNGSYRPAKVTLEYSTLANFPHGIRTVQTFTPDNLPSEAPASEFVPVFKPTGDTWWVVQHEVDHLNGKLYCSYFTATDNRFAQMEVLSSDQFPNPGYKTFPPGM